MALFRREVLVNKKAQQFGTVFINTPPNIKILATGISVLILLIIIFTSFAEFSEKYTVSGFLSTTKPTIKIYPKAPGIIVKSYLNQGASVKKGKPLFLIDTSYSESHKHEILKHLHNEKLALEKIHYLKSQHLQALRRLLAKKYVALSAFNEKKAEIIELEQKKTQVELDILRYQQNISYIIYAPSDGILSNILYKQGERIKPSKPLTTLVPNDSQLVAELYIPVRKSGFLNKDNKVLLQYDPYPYERFGTYEATIEDISSGLLIDEDELKPITIGEPYYKVRAKLDKQYVAVYGKQQRLQPGMTLSAIIVGPKRKIWQWIFDPLLSYTGLLIS